MKKMVLLLVAAGFLTIGSGIFRMEDVESAWLTSRPTDMFNEMDLLPQADRVARSLLALPGDWTNGRLYSFVFDAAHNQLTEAKSPRQKALEFLNASPLTPNFLLKLRIKEIDLACRIIKHHDPSLGSHINDPDFDYANLL